MDGMDEMDYMDEMDKPAGGAVAVTPQTSLP